jgi:hypothetical protein
VTEATVQRSRLGYATFALVCASPALPAAGWEVAQILKTQIPNGEGGINLSILTQSVDVFASILLVSTIINLLIVVVRWRDGPAAYSRPLRLRLWVGILYLLSLAWILNLGFGEPRVGAFEVIVCGAIAAASVGVFVWAVKGDPGSIARRTARVQARQLGDADPANRPEREQSN